MILPDDDAPMLVWALHYARAGFEVFPVSELDKTPMTGSKGFNDGTTDLAVTRSRWEQHPLAMIACRVPTDVVVLDIDPRHGGDKTLAELITTYGPITSGREHHSGRGDGGRHLWFTHPRVALSIKPLNDWARKTGVGHATGKNSWTCGIDILHHTWRYTILPPSLHPDTLAPYTWHSKEDPVTLPSWFVPLLTKAQLPPKTTTPLIDSDSIADWFSANSSWNDILFDAGWLLVEGDGDSDGSKWRHPNATAASSSSIKHGCLFVYTPNTEFEQTEEGGAAGYTRFRAWATTEHDGDLSAAARAARHIRGRSSRSTGWRSDPDTDESVEVGETPTSWSDAHVGEAFGATLVGRWLYCRALGGWHCWDGRRWALDQSEAVHEEFRQWIIALGDRLWKTDGDGETMKKVARYRDRGKIDAAVTIARRLTPIAAVPAEFDRHAHLLNCHNGVVDLRTGALAAHDPLLRLTKLAGAAFIAGATHPDVDTVMEALEPEVILWVQRLFGSAAYGAVLDDALVVFDGSGSNGKTTLLKAVADALGEYAAPATARLLIARETHDEHPTLLADLFGRRLLYIEETPEGGSLKMEQAKAITGGGKLKARFIGQNYFEFEPTHQLIVATNHRPAVNASDYAAWRRLRLVPFTKTYRLPHEASNGDLIADRGLRSRLGEVEQRQAALAWIVAGAVAWTAEGGLGPCPAVDEATAKWRREEDVIHAWWTECVTLGGSVPAATLYRSFVDWCTCEGRRYVSSNKEFVKRLTDHDLYRKYRIEARRTMVSIVYFGISMKDMYGGVAGSQNPQRGEPAGAPYISYMTRDDAKEGSPPKQPNLDDMEPF